MNNNTYINQTTLGMGVKQSRKANRSHDIPTALSSSSTHQSHRRSACKTFRNDQFRNAVSLARRSHRSSHHFLPYPRNGGQTVAIELTVATAFRILRRISCQMGIYLSRSCFLCLALGSRGGRLYMPDYPKS